MVIRTIPQSIIYDVARFCDLEPGDRLIFELINGQVMARIETSDVPVTVGTDRDLKWDLGTIPVHNAGDKYDGPCLPGETIIVGGRGGGR